MTVPPLPGRHSAGLAVAGAGPEARLDRAEVKVFLDSRCGATTITVAGSQNTCAAGSSLNTVCRDLAGISPTSRIAVISAAVI